MKTLKRVLFLNGIIMALLYATFLGAASAGEKIQIKIGTWGTTDASYFLAGAISRVLNEKIPQVNSVVVPSGTARNMVGFETGEISMGWTQSEALHFAPRGEGGGPFKKGEVYKKARVLLYLSPSLTHVIVLDKSKIKKISDINKSAKIAVHSPASSLPATIPLQYHGIKSGDYKLIYLDKGPQCEALQDGNIDVSFQSGSFPIPAITKLSTEAKIRFLYWDQEAIKKAVNDNTEYAMGIIPKDTYGKGNPETDYVSLGQLIALGASADMDEKIAYSIVKAICENVNLIKAVHVEGRLFTPENSNYWIGQLVEQYPFHPGAKRYLKERGVKFVE